MIDLWIPILVGLGDLVLYFLHTLSSKILYLNQLHRAVDVLPFEREAADPSNNLFVMRLLLLQSQSRGG